MTSFDEINKEPNEICDFYVIFLLFSPRLNQNGVSQDDISSEDQYD